MKLGYCTWGMPTVPADTFIPFLAQLGYDGIELTVIPGYTTALSQLDNAERRRIARMLHDHQLALPAIAGSADGHSAGSAGTHARVRCGVAGRRSRFAMQPSRRHRRRL